MPWAASRYELLTGRPPFQATSVRGLLTAHLIEPPDAGDGASARGAGRARAAWSCSCWPRIRPTAPERGSSAGSARRSRNRCRARASVPASSAQTPQTSSVAPGTARPRSNHGCGGGRRRDDQAAETRDTDAPLHGSIEGARAAPHRGLRQPNAGLASSARRSPTRFGST